MLLVSCSKQKRDSVITVHQKPTIIKPSIIIIDCKYSFEEAITGSKAPEEILQQLVLIDVQYYSMDGKIHRGQILTNKSISEKLIIMFDFILK